jgi:hypothetical protein
VAQELENDRAPTILTHNWRQKLMPYKYEFTTMHPSLMKDIKGPPTEIPATDLEQQVGGEATWTKTEQMASIADFWGGDFPPPLPHIHVTQTSVFTVKRKGVWVCTDIPHHFSQDRRIKVTHVTGYTKTDKKTFADTLEVSMTGKLWGFGTEIKNTLQLSEETEEQWHEETTTETEATFLGDHWYVSWKLLDVLSASRYVSYDQPFFRPALITSDFPVIITLYDDEVSDKDIHIAPSTDQTILKIRPLGI